MTDALPDLPPEIPAAEQEIVRSLEPALQVLALEHRARLKARGLRLQFNSGRRTHAHQLQIEADTAAASSSAQAHGEGLTGIAAQGISQHELGLAYDGEPSPKNDATWAIYGQEAKALGLVWGGDFSRTLASGETVTDRPHVQMPGKAQLWHELAAVGAFTALAIVVAILVKRLRPASA